MTFLVIVHLVACLSLIGIILLQPGKSDMGISFGSSSQSIFGSKGAGNFLTKVTTIAATVFISTSFFLTRARIVETERSVISSSPTAPAKPATPPAEAPKPESTQEKKQ